MGMLPYRELIVWQKAYALAMAVLDMAEAKPLATRFFFRDQMCDAAMSVPANIAEGNGRSTPADYASFLDRARASAFELDTWLLAARDRSYISSAEHQHAETQIREISAM